MKSGSAETSHLLPPDAIVPGAMAPDGHGSEVIATSPVGFFLQAASSGHSQEFFVRTTSTLQNCSFEGFPLSIDCQSKEFLFISSPDEEGHECHYEKSNPSIILHTLALCKEPVMRIAGVIVLVLMESYLRAALAAIGLPFPAAVAGLFLFFGFLCIMDHISSNLAEAIVTTFSPGVAFLSRWLGLLFVPSLVSIPTIADHLNMEEVPVALAIVTSKTIVMIVGAAVVGKATTACLASCQPPDDETTKPAAPLIPVLPSLKSMGTLLTILLCTLVVTLFTKNPDVQYVSVFVFWMSALFLVFSSALHVQRRAGSKVPILGQLLQPVVTTTIGVMSLVPLMAFVTDTTLLETLEQFTRGKGVWPPGAGDVVSGLLAPAVISMALGMFRSRKLFVKNLAVVLVVTFAITVTGITLLALASRFAGLSSTLAVSLVPTTATTPLAMESCRVLGGGDPKLSATGSIYAGVVGALTGRLLLNAVGIKDPTIRGLAIGGCSHGIGTGMLVMDEPGSAPFAAISFAIVGSMTASILSIPAVQIAVAALLGLHIDIHLH